MKSTTRLLKEYELDAPGLDKRARLDFRLQTRFLTAHIERLVPPVKNTLGAWKILVEVVAEVENAKPRNLLGVMVVQVCGNPMDYLQGRAGQREFVALQWLTEGVRACYAACDLDISAISNAVSTVVDGNFVNKWKWKGPIKSPDGASAVNVMIELDANVATATAEFEDARQAIADVQELFSTPPNEFKFVSRLGKIEWIDGARVCLTSKSGEEKWIASRNTSLA